MEITCPPNSIGIDSDGGSWYLYGSEKEILNRNFNQTMGEPQGLNQSGYDPSEAQAQQFEDFAPSASGGRPCGKDIDTFGQATGSAYPPFLDADLEGVSNRGVWEFLKPNEPRNIKHDQELLWRWVSQPEVSCMSTFIWYTCSND